MPNKETIQRYAISTLVTFFAGFAFVVAPALSTDAFNLESLESGAYVGVLLSGTRLGIKMVLEAFISWYNSCLLKKENPFVGGID